MVLRDKLYSFTAKQGRPIQQQYHHYKDGKASATYVTAQSRVSAHGNGEISRGRDACLGYVKRQMAFDASVMFLGLHIALSDIFHFLHACLCCLIALLLGRVRPHSISASTIHILWTVALGFAVLAPSQTVATETLRTSCLKSTGDCCCGSTRLTL